MQLLAFSHQFKFDQVIYCSNPLIVIKKRFLQLLRFVVFFFWLTCKSTSTKLCILFFVAFSSHALHYRRCVSSSILLLGPSPISFTIDLLRSNSMDIAYSLIKQPLGCALTSFFLRTRSRYNLKVMQGTTPGLSPQLVRSFD